MNCSLLVSANTADVLMLFAQEFDLPHHLLVHVPCLCVFLSCLQAHWTYFLFLCFVEQGRHESIIYDIIKLNRLVEIYYFTVLSHYHISCAKTYVTTENINHFSTNSFQFSSGWFIMLPMEIHFFCSFYFQVHLRFKWQSDGTESKIRNMFKSPQANVKIFMSLKNGYGREKHLQMAHLAVLNFV